MNTQVPAFYKENPEYLQTQLITYIGNKRALLPLIDKGIQTVCNESGKKKLNCLDVFSGSGIVARYLKQFSQQLAVNDLEKYSCLINNCYLSNPEPELTEKLKELHQNLTEKTAAQVKDLEIQRKNGTYKNPGFISELYSPADIQNIHKEDRCFYTNYNANYIDVIRQNIASDIPEQYQKFFTAPLLSEASIHANTAGIFKGFYKNSKTGIGQFGGSGQNALSRITGKICLPFPVFSNFTCDFKVFNKDANTLAKSTELYDFCPEYDLAYLDPPYNQHPYGSNYFMLNLIADYKKPDREHISRISGIPADWNRSAYNKKKQISGVFEDLIASLRAKFILISFNSEGFISKEDMIAMLSKYGSVSVLESKYNTFRGSRNLSGRDIHVKEYLFLLHKKPGIL